MLLVLWRQSVTSKQQQRKTKKNLEHINTGLIHGATQDRMSLTLREDTV